MTEPLDAATLGQTVRRIRREAGLTQAELAFAAGTGIRFVSELERGKATARLDAVLRVIEALGAQLSIAPRG